MNRIILERDKINVFGSFLDDKTFQLANKWIREETLAHTCLHNFAKRYQEHNESLIQYVVVLKNLARRAFHVFFIKLDIPNIVVRAIFHNFCSC